MRLRAFEGLWEIERAIEDLRAGRSGRFVGAARFSPVEGGLAYREEGTLTMAGSPPMAASRGFLWREGGAGAIEVRFEDGRFFHRFYADEAGPAAEHACPPDHYRVAYDFRAWPRWRADWRVRGPRKHYVLVSDYRPAGQGWAAGA